jgi:hypothetical protein
VKVRILNSEDLEEYWALKRLASGASSQLFPDHELTMLEQGERVALEIMWEDTFPGVSCR